MHIILKACLPALRRHSKLFFRRFLCSSIRRGVCPFRTFSHPEIDLRSLDFLLLRFVIAFNLVRSFLPDV